MGRNGLYLVIALSAVLAIGLGVYVYQQVTGPSVEVRMDRNGLSINGNPVPDSAFRR